METNHTTSTTFLFADPGDSLTLWEQSPTSMQAALPRFRAILQRVVADHSGEVFNYATDTLQAAFQSAPQAVSAALEAQRELLTASWDIPVTPRLALLTGSARREGGEFLGSALHRVARLLSVSHAGQILLCNITTGLAHGNLPQDSTLLDLGEHILPDLSRAERIYQLAAAGIPVDFPPLKSLNNQITNLPVQPNSLIGRQEELQTLVRLLHSSEVRLITLTGIGGSGKTRLALQAAAELFAMFPDGVFFVPLDQVADPSLVAIEVSQALALTLAGSQPVEDELIAHLQSRRTLLILDNYEHLMPAAFFVSKLLSASPQLKVLVTSRERLHLRGEREYPVSPLPLPDLHKPTPPEQMAQYASVALFIQRAQAARPDFAIDNHNAAAVAEICASLDGLPLAIELAAARVRLFTPQVLLSRLKAHPISQLLSSGPRDLPERQRTLRNALEWSYNLLKTEDQALFRSLGVFAGDITPEAVEAICYPLCKHPGDAFEALVSLSEKSLLRTHDTASGEMGFSMLYVLRQFAQELAEQTGELPAYRLAHATFYLALAEQARLELNSDHQVKWFTILERESDNLRAALSWAIANQQAEVAFRFISSLWGFWFERGHLREGGSWAEQVLPLAERHPIAPELRANVLFGTAVLMEDMGNRETARVSFEQCLEMYQRIGDRKGAAKTLEVLGESLYFHGDILAGARLLKESNILFREIGDKRVLSTSLVKNAWVAMEQGDYALAQTLLDDSLALARELADRGGTGYALSSLGILALYEKDYERAKRLLEESYQIFEAMGKHQHATTVLESLGLAFLGLNQFTSARASLEQALRAHQEYDYQRGIAETVEGLAGVASVRGASKRAATLFGAAEALRVAIQVPLLPSERARYDPMIKEARTQLKAADFSAAWSAGQELFTRGLDNVIAFALEPDDALSHPSGKDSGTGLTKREGEILRFLAQGLTDAQIAQKLFISPRTVNAHLTSVYGKLGVNSRSAATRFAVENGLV